MNKEKTKSSAASDEASEVQESSLLGQEDMDSILDTVTESDRTEKMVRVLPLHSVQRGTTRLGRPRKVERRPTEIDLEYHQAMALKRTEFIDGDPVVRAIDGQTDSADLLRKVKREVAGEAAALHFQRIENEKMGRDSAQVSTRRIDALTKIANIELEIRKMGAETINLKSEKMQLVFKYIVDIFREGCVETGMSTESIDLLFNWLGTHLEGWEDKAAELVRS